MNIFQIKKYSNSFHQSTIVHAHADIHTHDSVYLNVYSLTISTLDILVNITDCCFSRMVLDEMGSESGFDIFMFQNCIAVIN